MKRLFRFRTVRARLLTLMAIVVIPIAIVSFILAAANYNTLTADIVASQLQTVSGFTIRARIVLRGSLRLLVTSVAAFDISEKSDVDCTKIAQRTLQLITKHPALWVRFDNEKTCSAYEMPGLSDQIMSGIADEQSNKVFVKPLAGADIAKTRYDSVRVNGNLYIIVYAQNNEEDARHWQGILLIDPALMQSAFELGNIITGTITAIMHTGNEPLITRITNRDNMKWLPEKEVIFKTGGIWSAASKAGEKYTYASELIAEPNLYTLTRFDNNLANGAWYEFLLMSLTPVTLLLILAGSYAYAIQNTVIRWIMDIETASKSQNMKLPEQKLAIIASNMPSDMLNVATAFNQMIFDGKKREADLQSALITNNNLMRELHHRVKNSLQVIQSYISLSRRNPATGDNKHLAEAEAKIQVIAIAYRFALTDMGIKPVHIKPFVEEIVANLSTFSQKNNQWIGSTTESDEWLSVDRAIPLGLAIVEAATAGLQSIDATHVKISTTHLPSGEIQLLVTTDGVVDPDVMDKKIIKGLSLQLEARRENVSGNEVLKWIFTN